jgi:hypothetical protein
MTQPSPIPQSSSRNRSIWIVILVIGLVVGLVLGIFVSVLLNLPSSFHTGAGINNQVQVSGTVSETSQTTIYFFSVNRTSPIDTSVPIVNGQYSVILLGGRSYYVGFSSYYYDEAYTKYIPSGVSTFTANF